jgi:hypothetical protein
MVVSLPTATRLVLSGSHKKREETWDSYDNDDPPEKASPDGA